MSASKSIRAMRTNMIDMNKEKNFLVFKSTNFAISILNSLNGALQCNHENEMNWEECELQIRYANFSFFLCQFQIKTAHILVSRSWKALSILFISSTIYLIIVLFKYYIALSELPVGLWIVLNKIVFLIFVLHSTILFFWKVIGKKEQ